MKKTYMQNQANSKSLQSLINIRVVPKDL